MFSLLAERPLLLSLLLGTLAAGLICGWLQGGTRSILVAGLVLLALIPLVWIVESRWVTDRERLEQMLYDTAEAVEANRHAQAVSIIGDPKVRELARTELANYEFSEAEINSIRRIMILDDSVPKQAEVELTVKATVSSANGRIRDLKLPRRMLIRFEQWQPNDWVVVDYQHGPITGGVDAFSTTPHR